MHTHQDVVVRACGIHKAYGVGDAAFTALHDVSIAIRAGEAVAIVGKSGSGKSTLMHLLALLDHPDQGSIHVDGIEVARHSRRTRDRLRNEVFGFVFQQFFLIPNASVLDNVVLPLAIAGIPRRERIDRGMKMLAQVELADKAENRAAALSGGQKQRLVIARAIVNRPKVIFADEPTGNLDSATGAVVIDLLFALNVQEHITLVIVTHDEDLAARCDARFTISDGRIASASHGASAVPA